MENTTPLTPGTKVRFFDAMRYWNGKIVRVSHLDADGGTVYIIKQDGGPRRVVAAEMVVR